MYLLHLLCVSILALTAPLQGTVARTPSTPSLSSPGPSAWSNLPEHVVIPSMDQSAQDYDVLPGQPQDEPEEPEEYEEEEEDDEEEEEEIDPAELVSFFDILRTAFSGDAEDE